MEGNQKEKTVEALFERLKEERTDSKMPEAERDKIINKFIFILTKN